MTHLRLFLICIVGFFALEGCTSVVENGLSEEQANEVVVALHSRQIGAAKERDESGSDEMRFRVTVSSGDASRALKILQGLHLPERHRAGLDEVFAKSGIVPTATEERAKYVTGLGAELAHSIELIDGVLEARVHIGLADSPPITLDADATAPKASVLVKYRSATVPYDPRTVQALVAGAVHGLVPENVTVMGIASHTEDTKAVPLEFVGPFAVSSGSASLFRVVLIGALSLDVLLALLLVFVLIRKRGI